MLLPRSVVRRRIQFAALIGTGLFCAAGLRLAANAADTRTYYFREPQSAAYVVANQQAVGRATGGSPAWTSARTGGQEVELGHRIVVGLSREVPLDSIIANRPLRLDRVVSPGPHDSERTYILQADNALAAAREADAISRLPGVVVSCPVIRRPMTRHGRYAEPPNDELFAQQWHLENRSPDGARAGVDLNVRAAWPLSRGKNIAIAIADDGVDLRHPELESRAVNMPHFNFLNRNLSGEPTDGEASHGTAVAGLALAELNNSVGVAGVAPEARLASWVVLGRVGLSDEDAMDMYQHRLDVIDVQNHSWGSSDNGLNAVRFLEQIGLSNSVTFGRAGRGTVIVRSAGNGKGGANNANDYGHANDPRVIAVGAVRFDGRVTSYSERGACVLVSAPSADSSLEFPTILTTDRQGALGYNRNSYTNDLADYAFDTNGFSGTSASAPQISGMVALVLAANANLTYHDVQHILVNASRHLDLADPALTTNGAGFRVSHNVGFGVPDAGRAVRLALQWTNLPPLTNLSVISAAPMAIPDDSLLAVTAEGLPEALTAPAALPSLGPESRFASAFVPLVDVGLATNAISVNLTGKAAFIQRGTNFFRDKIEIAADAGAAFAIIYNNRDTNELVQMAATDFTRIPAVFIGQNDGDAIAAFLQTNAVAVQLRPGAVPARVSLTVTQTLICEHVGVRLRTDHSRRGDLRIVLTSPSGTRSVLQHLNFDDAPGPLDWVYYSTQHFYEPTAGTWELAVSDERKSQSGGMVLSAELRIAGWPIVDSDADGLDDAWETNYFAALSFGARDDPDQDGYGNAQEQILRSNPVHNDVPFTLDISRLNPGQTRLSWPSSSHFEYRILAAGDAGQPFVPVTNVVADFPETEWIAPATGSRLFRLESISAR